MAIQDSIPFAYDVLLPEGPLGNGVDGPRPYGLAPVYLHLRQIGKALDVDIAHVDQPFVYAIGSYGTTYRFFGGDKPSMLVQIIPDKAIDALRARQAVLLLDCAQEGDCWDFNEIFMRIYQLCMTIGISPSQVVFACGNLACQDRHTEWVYQHQLPPTAICTVVPINTFRQFMADRMRFRLGEFVTEPDLPRRRSKHFLCYNRRLRPHRFVLASHLLKHQEKVYLSFPPLDFSEQIPMTWRPPIATLDEDLRRLDALRPLIVDQVDFETNHALTHVAWPYLDSYISLTSETVFQQAVGVFLSEKTYRPIANLQPFLLIGSAGSLYRLRAMGFRTFAPFIDERYDEITDNDQRMLLILAEIDRLAALPLHVIHDWYCSIMPDLWHNRQVLLDTPDQYTEVTETLTRIFDV